jgi:hypothetical protein
MGRSGTDTVKGNATHSTRARAAAKNTNIMAAELLKQVVEKEKSAREATKKKRAEEKRAEEELKKKLDAEKEAAIAPTVSPINTVADIAAATEGMTIELDNLLLTPTSETTEEGEDDSPECHRINLNQLSYAATIKNNGTNPSHPSSTSINSPVKKKKKRKLSKGYKPLYHQKLQVRATNRYTTKSFSITQPEHTYANPRTFVEAAITLTKDDKPKEFIAAIKLLLTNGKILDSHFALAPLKPDTSTKTKLLTTEDDVPNNFTHLGQYAYTSGNQIFEKKKDWKQDNNAK